MSSPNPEPKASAPQQRDETDLDELTLDQAE